MFRARVWLMTYRWTWLDELFTVPLMDERYTTMEEAMSAVRDMATSSTGRPIRVSIKESAAAS